MGTIGNLGFYALFPVSISCTQCCASWDMLDDIVHKIWDPTSLDGLRKVWQQAISWQCASCAWGWYCAAKLFQWDLCTLHSRLSWPKSCLHGPFATASVNWIDENPISFDEPCGPWFYVCYNDSSHWYIHDRNISHSWHAFQQCLTKW